MCTWVHGMMAGWLHRCPVFVLQVVLLSSEMCFLEYFTELTNVSFYGSTRLSFEVSVLYGLFSYIV